VEDAAVGARHHRRRTTPPVRRRQTISEDRAMHFQELHEDGWRIYVGALEAPHGDGYTAALVVQRAGASPATPAASPRDGYRDDSLACGHRWNSPEDAMSFALRKGRAWVRARDGLQRA
jgi:hypothetical protein